MSVNKTALVLGANGFLGQNLCYWLVQNNFNVVAVGRSESFAAASFFNKNQLTYIKTDLLNKEQVKNLPLESSNAIYMMAGQTGTKIGFSEYSTFVESNEIALLNVLNEYKEKEAKGRLVFPSSRLVYKGQKGILLKENSEKEAKTVYAANKIACELYLSCWANAYNVPYTVFRICVPYGQLLPGEYSYGTLGFMLNQAKQHGAITLYGKGEPSRTFSHVEDICEILGKVPFIPKSLNKTINIGSQDNFQLLKLAELIAAKFHVKVKFKKWPSLDLNIESGDTMFDDTLLQSISPYTYKRNIADFIKELN